MLLGFELIPLVVIGLIVLVVASVASDRRDPDPTGRRPYSIYLVAVTLIALFALLFSSTAVVSALVQIPLRDEVSYDAFGGGVSGGVSVAPQPAQPQPGQPQPPTGAGPGSGRVGPPTNIPPAPIATLHGANREHIRQAIQTALIAIAAAILLLFHARRLRELIHEPGFAEGPARRAYQVYVYVVCFVGVLIVLVAGSLAAFGLVRIIAPGTTGFEGARFERDDGIRQLATNGFLAIAAAAILRWHWLRAAALRTPPAPVPPEPAPGV
jgi:hypothetical protein